MTYTLDKLKKKLALPESLQIKFPPAEIEADLAIPCFREDPKKIASKIKRLKLPLIEEIKIEGRYVNLILNKNLLAKQVFNDIEKAGNEYGWAKDGKKILIEYSSPNVAKPMHIGHLRNNVIGHALENIYKARGNKVTTVNHIGDWGTQFGRLILAWQKWGPKPITVENLYKLYVRINKQCEKNKKLEQEARDLFTKLEAGDKKLEKLWDKFRTHSIKEFKKIYKEFDMEFDLWQGESFYQKESEKIIKEALKKGVATKEEDGAIVVDLEKHKLPSYILQKADGSTLYAGRDLAAAKWRLKNNKPARILYVVGHEQELYFKQIFKTLELLGYDAGKLEHISYNLITIKGKKASTRAGRTIFLNDVIKETLHRTKKNKIIGLGALVYNTVSQRRNRAINFDWKKTLNLEGDSAPYIQYGYVRAQSILKKAKQKKINGKIVIKTEREIKLVKLLAQYPEIIKQSQLLNEPHLIANYLNDLVQEFNRFYNFDPVLAADESNKIKTRLMLVASVAKTIKNGLALLGIKVPKKM